MPTKTIKHFIILHSLRLISNEEKLKQTNNKNATEFSIRNRAKTSTKAVKLIRSDGKQISSTWWSMVYRYAFINNNNEWHILWQFSIELGSTANVHVHQTYGRFHIDPVSTYDYCCYYYWHQTWRAVEFNPKPISIQYHMFYVWKAQQILSKGAVLMWKFIHIYNNFLLTQK